ncbi:MAG TPA: hypothetical protein VGT61_07810 [Thermomicrobiales bacterium]|nr:hypothetical protein [Thermomicrobiales bacterium]
MGRSPRTGTGVAVGRRGVLVARSGAVASGVGWRSTGAAVVGRRGGSLVGGSVGTTRVAGGAVAVAAACRVGRRVIGWVAVAAAVAWVVGVAVARRVAVAVGAGGAVGGAEVGRTVGGTGAAVGGRGVFVAARPGPTRVGVARGVAVDVGLMVADAVEVAVARAVAVRVGVLMMVAVG